MKRIVNAVVKWFSRTTLCFTLVLIGMSLAGFATKPDSNAIYCSQVLYLFAFSALIGVSFCVSELVKKNAVICRTLQFVLCYISFVLTFYLGGAGKSFLENQSANKAFTVICTTLIFIGIYVVVAVIVWAYGAVIKKIAGKNEKYQKQFEEVNTGK